jgi:hypothetical protein
MSHIPWCVVRGASAPVLKTGDSDRRNKNQKAKSPSEKSPRSSEKRGRGTGRWALDMDMRDTQEIRGGGGGRRGGKSPRGGAPCNTQNAEKKTPKLQKICCEAGGGVQIHAHPPPCARAENRAPVP